MRKHKVLSCNFEDKTCAPIGEQLGEGPLEWRPWGKSHPGPPPLGSPKARPSSLRFVAKHFSVFVKVCYITNNTSGLSYLPTHKTLCHSVSHIKTTLIDFHILLQTPRKTPRCCLHLFHTVLSRMSEIKYKTFLPTLLLILKFCWWFSWTIYANIWWFKSC